MAISKKNAQKIEKWGGPHQLILRPTEYKSIKLFWRNMVTKTVTHYFI